MEAEIPVWVNSRQRWVTGVGRKTTCDDVIAVLLRGGEERERSSFAIMERWRRVERPLDGRARILRVWNAWGDARGEVRLTLRRVDGGEADSGRGSPVGRRRRHHHHHHRSGKLPWPSHQTLHPRRLAQLGHQADLAGAKLPETIERLMKLILAQGETIQSQLRRLRDRDHQIEHLEDETHRERVETLGSNYLLETYLGSVPQAEAEEEKGNDSGVVTEGGSDQASPVSSTAEENARCPSRRDHEERDDDEDNFADESDIGTKEQSVLDDDPMLDLQSRIEFWEKLVKVNRRLEREEECLVRLHIKFRRYRSKHTEEGGLRVLPEEDLDEEGCQMRDGLLGDLEKARVELEQGVRELEHNSQALQETDALLDARRHYLRRLQAELEASDRETERLQHHAAALASDLGGVRKAQHCPPAEPSNKEQQRLVTATQVKSNPGNLQKSLPKTINDTDSNSDTGLSSLHSGSEEGVYILDTLV